MAFVHTGLAAGLAPGAALSGVVVDAAGASPAYLVSAGAGVVAALAAQTLPTRSLVGKSTRRLETAGARRLDVGGPVGIGARQCSRSASSRQTRQTPAPAAATSDRGLVKPGRGRRPPPAPARAGVA